MGREDKLAARAEYFKFDYRMPEDKLVSHSHRGCKEGGFGFFLDRKDINMFVR